MISFSIRAKIWNRGKAVQRWTNICIKSRERNLENFLHVYLKLLYILERNACFFSILVKRHNSVNQCLRHNLENNKIHAFRHTKTYTSLWIVSTDQTVYINDYMLNKRFTIRSKITLKWNLTKLHGPNHRSQD